jgi:hypothetical protein
MRFAIQNGDQLKKVEKRKCTGSVRIVFSATSIFFEHVAKTGTCHCQHDIISGPLSTVEVPCEW